MQKIYLALLFIISCHVALAQGENCSAAVTLVNGACVAGTPGTSQNIVGCVGNADDDSWYKFVATGTSHSLTVTGSAGYDAVLQFFSGTCSALISGACVDNTLSGQTESTVVTGLTIGATYYVRVYHYFAGSGAGTFTMCLNNPPPAPANDNCVNAINLPVNASCVSTTGTSFGATNQALYPACAGTANDDVWYSFTATNYTQTIQVTGSAAMDPVVELYSGSCGSFTSLSCTDNTFSGGTETVSAGGLTPGNTYFFRVYDYYSTSGASFSVCVSGVSIIAGTQPNDEPCNAIVLPPVTADCNYSTFSNIGATQSTGAPAPTGCTGGTGGWGATSKDVWFAIVVPASGNLCITPQPNLTGTVVTDGVMALYSGSCGSLTQIACSDDADGTAGIYNYPGTANDFLPYLNATGLTPGITVYLRYWGWGSEAGDFGICVQAPTNDLCSNALYICDINGYSASTSPAYTPDRPGTGAGQMFGNNETAAGVNQPDGTNTGGIFGYYPPSNIAGPYSSPAIDVNIENNSWIRFTAASPTIALRVSVYDCWENGAGNQGVQMQIFSGTNCSSFTPVSSFQEGIGTYTLNATGLTVGNNYYLMVDGWGGNICNYNIQAVAGVAFPNITAAPGSICPGQSSILTAPSGATGYTWEPTGQNTQTISVAPGTTMTYTCFVGGVCGYKQTLTKTVTIMAAPSVSINSNNPITTCGTQTITLTGGGASTYSWSTGSTASSFTVAPSGSQSYSVIGTAANGCTNTAVSNVTVNTLPTIVPGAVGSNTICTGSNASLTVSGANTYTWSPAATLSSSTGTAVTATPTTGTNYTIIGTAANGCTNSATYSVTVNSKPTVGSTTTGSVICGGNSTTLNGTGASTYTWTGGVTDGVAFTPTATLTYTVTGTNAATGCTNTAVRTITVTPTPTVGTTASNSVICIGNSVTLNGSGATTYTWSGGVSNGVAFSPTNTTTYTVTGATSGCTNTAVRTITVNPLPVITTTTSGSAVCNGQSTSITASGASTYTWTGGISNGAAFTPTATNSYTVTGTDANGCVNTSVRSITVNPIPTSTTSTSGTITCATNTINLNSSLAGANYTWTAPGGSSISGGTTNNQNAIGQGAGTYTLQVMSAAGCTYSTTLATNVNTLAPTASAGNGTLTCAVTSTVLTGGPATGVTYSWSGPGIIGSSTIANITASVVGTYSLVTTSTVNGCSSTAAAVGTLTNNLTTPTVTAGSNQTITCAAPTVTLSGSATAGSNYNWSNGALTSTTTVSGSGTYTLTAIYPSTGCSSTATVQVLPSAGTPTGNISAASNSITCANTSATVSITSGSSPISILWTGPGITGPTNTASTTVSQGNVTYTVTLTNTSSMCSQSYNVFVPLNTTPVVASATISAGPSSITCSTNSLTLSASPTGANYSYTWTGPGIVSGGNTANPVVNLGGTYSVTITNTVNGCSGVNGTTNVAVPSNTATPTLSLSATSATTSCGNPGVTVTASSNANPNTTYTWTAPATGTISSTSVSNPSIGGSGVFTVALTNTVSGCPAAPMTVTVTADANVPTFTLSASSLVANCTTPAPGVTIATSPAGLIYSWSPVPNSGGNTASPTFTAAGTYTCLVTNPTNSCSTNAPVVTVSVDKTIPTATATPASSVTCSNTLVTISSTVTPAANVTLSWTGPNVISGNTTLSPTIGTGGNYVVAMTNTVNGCANSYTVNVPTNTVVPTINLAANSLTTTCANPTATFNASSSAPSATYSWTSPAGGSLSSNTSNSPTASGSGVFTVSATDPVNGCISASTTATLTADANIPTFSLPANTATITCAVSNPSVSLTSTVSGVTYSWSPVPASGITTASPTFTAPGSYTCLITNPTNSCSTSGAVVSVTQDMVAPTATAAATSSITCSTNSLNITSVVTPSNNVTYNWTGPIIVSGANSLTPVIGAGGDYVIAMTNTVNGCSNTYTVNVPSNTVTPNMNVAANAYTTTCSVPGVMVSASSSSDPATTYSWTAPSTGTISNSAISNPVVGGSGVFTVAVTNTVNGCVSSIATVTITPDQNIPTFSLQATTATINCSVPSPSVSLTSTVSGVTYSWSPVPASGATAASPTFTAAGNYTCTITNPANNCSTNAAQVSVNTDTTAPVATITPNASVTCNSATVTLSSTVTPSSATYTWSGSGISGGVNGTSVIATSGSYSLTVTDPVNGCSVTATAAVGTDTATPTLTVASTSTVISCSTTSSTLTASSVSGTPTWVIPGGSSATNPVTATVPGNYVATVTDSNNGCVTSQTISITGNTVPPDANAGATTAIPCNTSSVTLSGSSTSTDVVTYSWTGPAAGSITSATNISNPTVISAGVYTLTVTNSNTGCSQTASVSVTQNNVTAGFNADPTSGEAPLPVTFTNTSVGATSYNWSFGNGSTSNSQDPSTVFVNSGTYTVVLTAYNGGCSDTAVRVITVEDGFSIEIPNVFTPNGDGVNEAFHIKTSGVKSAEGFIYNRWGQQLYSWDVLNISWDGKASNGENCPDGTYYYLIKVIDKKDKEHLAPGFVLIAR